MDKRSIGLGIVLSLVSAVFISRGILPLWLNLVVLVAALFIIGEGILQGRAARDLSEDPSPPSDG